MKRHLALGLTIRKSQINGKGCFATKHFSGRRKIAEYTGEKISNAEANRRANRKTLRICAINNRWSLDGSSGGNGTHYINHSCEPNAFMQILYRHILFIALRDIQVNDGGRGSTDGGADGLRIGVKQITVANDQITLG